MDHSINDYDLGQLIGRGGFASVYRAIHRRSGEEVALKVSDKARIEQLHMADRVANEIRIHSTLPRHRNVVRATKFFEDEESTYLVMELCTRGNLYRELRTRGKFSESEAKIIMRQLLLAIQHLHNEGVVHRDLKLSNILMAGSQDSIEVKLCDFGLAARIEHPDEEHFTLCGTPNYIAPEIASNQAHGYPADLWSLGCLFYTLVVGTPPFEPGRNDETEFKFAAMAASGRNGPRASRSQHTRSTFDRIISGQYAVPDGVELSPAGRALLATLLNQDPVQRTSAREVLQSPYFSGEGGGEEEREEKRSSRHASHSPRESFDVGVEAEEEEDDSSVSPALSIAFLQGQVGHACSEEGREEEGESSETALSAQLLRPRPSEEPSMASLPSQAKVTRLKQKHLMFDSLVDEEDGGSCESKDKQSSSEDGVNLSQRLTRDLGRALTKARGALGPRSVPQYRSQLELEPQLRPEERTPVLSLHRPARERGQEAREGTREDSQGREVQEEAGLRVSTTWLSGVRAMSSSHSLSHPRRASRMSTTAMVSASLRTSDAENLPPPRAHASHNVPMPSSVGTSTARQPLSPLSTGPIYSDEGANDVPLNAHHDEACSLPSSASSGTYDLQAIKQRSQEALRERKQEQEQEQEHVWPQSGSLWTEVADRVGPFCLTSPEGELLVLSEEGTLLFCVPTQRRDGTTTFARLLAYRDEPLTLHVARADAAVEADILSVMRANVEGIKSQEREGNRVRDTSMATDGENEKCKRDAPHLRISYSETEGPSAAFGRVYTHASCRALTTGINRRRNSCFSHTGDHTHEEELDMLVASHPLSCLPPAVHNAFRKATRILDSVTKRAPDSVLYLTKGSLLRMAQSHARSIGANTTASSHSKPGGAVYHEDKSSFISGITSHSATTAASEGENDSEGKEKDSTIVCKCMLMRNLPMPDFCIQWNEGTTVRYQLQDGTMRVDTPRGEPSSSSLSRLFASEAVSEADSSKSHLGSMVGEAISRDLRDVSGYTDCADETTLHDVEEGEGGLESSPMRWQGCIGATDVVIPPRVAGYVCVAQKALGMILEQCRIDNRASRASTRNAGPKVAVL